MKDIWQKNKNVFYGYLITCLVPLVIVILFSGNVCAEGDDALFIESNGNVGIGTASPEGSLDIGTTSTTKASVKLTGISVLTGADAPEIANISGFGMKIGTFKFAVDSNHNGSDDFVIESNGNVGIGTTTPEATLDVKGTVKALGNWETRATNTPYQALSDGFVVANIEALTNGDHYGWIAGKTDGESTPKTVRASASVYSAKKVKSNSFMMPVKKDDYWKVDLQVQDNVKCKECNKKYKKCYEVTINWIPLGRN